jgi:hypothetical protein
MNGAIYSQSPLDQRLFISEDTQDSWCAYLLRMSETYEASQIDFKTIWDGTGNRNFTKYRGDFLFARKKPKKAGTSYHQKIRAILNDKINVPYSIGLVWILDPDTEPTDKNIFVIPLWEQATKKYQIAMESNFSFGNGICEITAKKAVAAKREITGDYSAIQIPTSASTGLTTGPHPVDFGLQLKDGTVPSTRHTNQILRDSYITIPVNGENAGCLRFEMSLLEKEDLLELDLAQKYFYENGSFTEFNYPILKSGREHYEVFCQASIDPANLLNEKSDPQKERPNRTYFAFTGKTNYKLQSNEPHEDTLFDTFFKTETGYGLRLKPFVTAANTNIEFNNYFAKRNSARLVFSRKKADSNDFYFAPAGDFHIEYHPDGLPENLDSDRTQLLSGLSGTESIGFQPTHDQKEGDKIRFRPYRPAFAPYFPIEQATSNSQIICEPKLTDISETSYVNIIAKNGSPVIYYAQSEGASLYAKEEADGEFLEFFEPGVEMPQLEDFAVPLVPYLGVEATSKIVDFETQILSPIRKTKIAKENPKHKIDSNSDYVHVTTPQGLIAKIDNIKEEGKWKEVIVSENTESAIDTEKNNYVNFKGSGLGTETPEFKFGFINLQKELQEVFQSNQQFLVATDPKKFGTLVSKLTDHQLNYAERTTPFFNNRMYINDWPFDVNTGDNGDVTGEFRNVLIMKFCKGTLRERIQNPSLWTDSCEFNQKDHLNAISEWLQNYLSEAKKQNNKYYEYFNTIVDDPNWNGVLALKLDLDADAFPDNLKGLLGGMDLSRLFIHHFGIEINHIDTSDVLKIGENSSMFGLIDYKDELYNPDNPEAPVAADTSPFDFKVTTLQVLFENSDIKDFACKVQVSLDELFKETVSEVRIPSLNLDETDSNSVVFNGTYEDHNGKSVYTFASTADTFFDLNSHVLHFIEIERAIFETLSDDEGSIKSRFNFWGNMNFEVLKEGAEETDLLSFGWEKDAEEGRGLTFNNLQLYMNFDLPTGDETGVQNREFDLVTDYFEPFLQNSYARENGLYSKFPLDFQGFVFGASDKTPSDLGYLTVNVKGTFNDDSVWGVSTESLTTDWYGLKYKMNLGTPGELASKIGFEVNFMIAWSPQISGDTTPRVFLGMTLPGPGGANKIMNLQDIINFSIGDLELDFHEESGAFELRFQDIGFKFFNLLKLPGVFEDFPLAQANFCLFANANSPRSKNLGWFLSYAESVSPQLVNVLFLALGQHVALQNYDDVETMEDAIEAMKNAFIDYRTTNFSKLLKGTSDPVDPIEDDDGNIIPYVSMDFDEKSNWLIAFHLGLLSPDFADPNLYAIEASVIFNDPNLYGLKIAANGDTVKFFDGLEFEILYKKIKEGLGVYRAELTLPSKLRELKVGAAKITIGTIAVKIFTNGDFFVDLGFPFDRDFSRSFDVEVQIGPVPAVGAFGLYFGKLNGDTATDMPEIYNDPATGLPLGKFDPVMVFGLGLEVGVGKSYEEGPLSAEIRVTLVGIIEGIIATWLPASAPNSNSGSVDDSTYYWIKGTIGIVGMLEGKVDFKIIKAGVEVELYALVSAIFESFKEIPLTLSAGVEVKVTVEVDMGLFTVKEDFSFDAHVEQEFTIGKNEENKAPWRQGGIAPLMAMASRSLMSSGLSTTFTSTNKQPLNLYFNLANTMADESGGSEVALIATLMMESADVRIPEAGDKAFDKLAEQVFRWMTHDGESVYASDNDFDDRVLSSTDLQNLQDNLLTNPEILRPITTTEIYEFLTNNFEINVLKGESGSFSESDVKATMFPMIPNYSLEIAYDESVQKTIKFDEFSQATEKYLTEELSVFFGDLKYQNTISGNTTDTPDNALSLAEYNFEDYFTMIAREMVSSALKTFRKYNYPIQSGDSLTSIQAHFSGMGNGVSIEAIAVENRFHPLSSGQSLHERAISENKTVEALAIELKDQIDLFDTTVDAHLSIPNLTNLSINEIFADLFFKNTTAHLSGMTMRYQLHGLRLPKTNELTLNSGTWNNGSDYGFYKLTGQQFLLPEGLPFEVIDEKNVYKNLNINLIYGASDTDKVTLTYDNDYVTTKNSAFDSALNSVNFGELLNSKDQFKEIPHHFKFKSHLHFGDNLIWNFSDNLLNQIHSDSLSFFSRGYAVQIAIENEAKRKLDYSSPETQNWGTLIDITIRKYPDETGTFRYELIGTDEFGIVFLERMLQSGAASQLEEHQFNILYNKIENDSLFKHNFESKGITSLYTFINQANLSTETNPPEFGEMMSRSAAMVAFDDEKHILNEPLDFLKYIWECSITRTGGYYLYYEEVGGTTFPNEIFSEDNTAIIRLFIQHNIINELPSYANCVLTDSNMDLKNSIVFAETADLKDKCAMLPQGVLTYEISRTKPEDYTTTNDDGSTQITDYKKYLESIYHLMSYRIVEITEEVDPSDDSKLVTIVNPLPNFSLPIGPTTDMDEATATDLTVTPQIDDGNWTYKLNIPFYKYAPAVTMPAPFDLAENIYAGVGTSAQIEICWKDLFGNCAFDFAQKSSDNDENLLKIGYTDKLLSINQWPNVEFFYDINAGNLNVHLIYKVHDFNNNNASYNQELKLQVKKTYEQIYLQLNQIDSTNGSHVDIKILSTLFDNEFDLPQPNRDELNAFLSAIYAKILDENADLTTYNVNEVFQDIGEGNMKNTLEKTIAIPISDRAINPNQIFELEAEMNFIRKTDLVHTDFQDVDSVCCGKTHLPPLLETEKTNEDGNTKHFSTLTAFAQNFENSFATQNLKIAAGINKDEINTASKFKDIWVVKMDASNFGFDLTNSTPIYYAMKPFSTTLRTGDVEVKNYLTGTGIEKDEEGNNILTTETFTEVDMDAWMLQFLEAIDLFLSPKYTTGAFLVDETKLEELISAKNGIAEAIKDQLITVFEQHNSAGSGTALNEAREKLKQRLLVKLADAYKVNTVVQFPVNKASTTIGGTNSPQFYGSPTIEKDNSNRDYAFSTAKINLDGSPAHLTFLFSTKHIEEEPFVNFDLKFQISHLEHDFDEPIDGYTASSWLAFVLPPDTNLLKSLGNVDIPVVLRAYPAAPSLVNQMAQQSLIEDTQSQLANATQWDYFVKYSQTAAGQDSIKSEIHLNVESGFVPPQEMNSEVVFPALANFIKLYPQILTDLKATLPLVTKDNKNSVNLVDAQKAVEAFVELVLEVCDCMTAEISAMSALLANNLDTVSFNFEIQESSSENDILNVRVEPLSIIPSSHSLPTPKIEIENYDIKTDIIAGTGEKNYQYGKPDADEISLDWATAKSIKERRIHLENLDILKYQNVTSGIWLKRNEDLSEELTTNTEFIYTTPRVNFPNKLVPMLDNRQPINIKTEVNPNGQLWELEEYLKAFFEKFFDKGQGEDQQVVKLECSYGYRIQDNLDLPEIKLPILLAPPTIFDIPGNESVANDFDINNAASFVSKLAASIQTWFDENQPSDANTNERFIFDVAVFSKIEESKLPIVRLRNVFLNRDDVKRQD